MENCSLPNGCCCQEARLGGEEADFRVLFADWIRVPPSRLGGGFSSNVQSNLARLSSSSLVNNRCGWLGCGRLGAVAQNNSLASVWLPFLSAE
ncbi:hypothetical protein SLEP1_g49281 [Rubroshorea leprosula]|uniref:Uncharacterized protein n=1 Tax=Rubroshorea leprosula TaxID=152421 RepID=A0AAV5LXK3_9ROSI|nr:hypothetical protein SLEP1_g49281 [Rubroshorea leprosula]